MRCRSRRARQNYWWQSDHISTLCRLPKSRGRRRMVQRRLRPQIIAPSTYPLSTGKAATSTPRRIGSPRRCSSGSSFVALSGSRAVVPERCPPPSLRTATKWSRRTSPTVGSALWGRFLGKPKCPRRMPQHHFNPPYGEAAKSGGTVEIIEVDARLSASCPGSNCDCAGPTRSAGAPSMDRWETGR